MHISQKTLSQDKRSCLIPDCDAYNADGTCKTCIGGKSPTKSGNFCATNIAICLEYNDSDLLCDICVSDMFL